MRQRLFALLILAAGVLAACTAVKPTPSRPVLPTPSSPVPSPTPTSYCFTPVPFESLSPYPTPEGFRLGMADVPVQALPPGVTPPEPAEGPPDGKCPACPFYLVGEKQIGRYSVREWQHTSTDWGLVTISTANQILVQIEYFRLNVSHAGRDITGEGHPDVVVSVWYAGASMISTSEKVYDLGPTVTQVLDTPFVSSDPVYYLPCPWPGVFADLDRDGSAEYITCDDAARYGYYSASSINPYAEHRQMEVTAVLDYKPGRGYVPASPDFAYLYAGNIDMYTRQAEEQAGQQATGEAGSRNDPLVALAMNYLYSGQSAKAWAELDRLYHGPDKVFLWSEILRIASNSPFYTPGGPFPDVPVPAYYALQLRQGCEPHAGCPRTPAEGQPTCEPAQWLADRFAEAYAWPISILSEGQKTCDPAAPQRSKAWFEDQLRQLGLLEWDETLEVSPSDGTTACRLDVVRFREDTATGFIQLDMSRGFPGEVRRIDLEGRESTSWRLRGDLNWEVVPP
jgi:hypothetical protein